MIETTDQNGWQFLVSEEGQTLLASLNHETEARLKSLALVTELRASGLPAGHVSAVLSQALLQRRAVKKFGDRAFEMHFTEAGLEQASRAVVAQSHAARFTAAGLSRVVDLGCGIGAESLALADAGIQVQAVEIDPVTAQLAEFNLRAHPHATITVGDAETFPLDDAQGAFLDPARRTSGHRNTARITDASEYSPGLDFAYGIAERMPTAIKLGPGFDRAEIPATAHAQWTSVDGEAVEMMLWFGALATPGITRSALVIRGTEPHTLESVGDAPDEPVRQIGEYLYEPDPAVIRARLIGDLARDLGFGMLDEQIAYLTGDAAAQTPFAQGFRVREVLPVSESKLKKLLRERSIGRLEIKKRGMDVDPAQLRKRLALRGEHEATLILTRADGERVAILADRI